MIIEKEINAYADGKTELKDLLELTPEVIDQLRGRAQFFIDGGHRERALMMLEMLEELDRSDPLPSLLAIEILLAQGLSDAAEEKVRALLERRPEDPDVLVALAEYQIAVGEMVPAAETLARVIDADADGRTAAGQRALAVAAEAHDRLAGG